MSDASPLLTILSAVLASSVIAAFIANRASYKSIAVEAITKERITWLDELREISAKLAAELAQINRNSTLGLGDAEQLDQEEKKAREEAIFVADTLYARLQLQLNPYGISEQNILTKAKELIGNVEKNKSYREEEEKLLQLVRGLLKEEWDKAKREAGVAEAPRDFSLEFIIFFFTVVTAGNILFTTRMQGIW